jgi:hypothetical protein
MLYLPALIVAAVLMACAVVVLVVSEKAEATFPGKNGRIAYASYDAPFPKGDSEIYTINPDGSGKTQLTNNNTDDLDPSYSPDGKKIVYAGQDGPKGDLEIYTINARGGDKFQLTHNDVDEEWPTYSPSSKRIAYTPIEGADGIYSVKAGGGGKRLVARNGGVPSYSPDGKRIAYECYGRAPGSTPTSAPSACAETTSSPSSSPVIQAGTRSTTCCTTRSTLPTTIRTTSTPTTRPTATGSPIWDPTARSTRSMSAGEGSPDSLTTMRTPRSSPGVLVRSGSFPE